MLLDMMSRALLTAGRPASAENAGVNLVGANEVHWVQWLQDAAAVTAATIGTTTTTAGNSAGACLTVRMSVR